MSSYDRYKEEIKKSRDRFKRDAKAHTMTVLHNEGLYRHLRLRNPAPGRSEYWYDVVTWPGNLAIRGDFGQSYVFSVATDMFEFFAHHLHKDGSVEIDPQYWSEKLSSGDQSRKYDDEVFKDDFREQARQMIEGGYIEEDQKDRFLAAIEEFFENEIYHDASTAIMSVESFEFWNNEEHEHSHKYRNEAIRFEEPWEWINHSTAYEWSYLWACWGIMRAVKEFYSVFGRPTVSLNDKADTQDTARMGVPVG